MNKNILVIGMILLIVCVVSTPLTESTVIERSTFSRKDGNTLYVGGSGPGNYTFIQDAIDDASDGDTVFVFDDSSPYFEYIVVDKSINLIGEDKNTTVIYAGSDFVVYLDADEINIKGFTIKNGDYGIVIEFSNNNTITDNYIKNNGCAIYLADTSNNIIMENNIESNNWNGIYLDDKSLKNNIIGNTISDNEGGLCIRNSNTNNIFNNSFFNDGLIVYKSYHNNVVNNTVNNKPLVYLVDKSDIVIDDEVGQVILINCKNITIENQNLSNTEVGIELWKTINCNIINNNCLMNDNYGIILYYSENNTFIGNNISSNRFIGIHLTESSNNILRDCTFLKNDYGIGFWYSSQNNIINNIISNNIRYGINLGRSNNNKITDNTISDNGLGILCGYCNNNTIYHNKFIENSEEAYDYGNNIWDDGYPSGGNFWCDYNGTDSNGDGIGDSSYPIPPGDNEDRYPLIYPWGNSPPDAPTINGPSNGRVEVEYDYDFNAVDSDGDNVSYEINWGDGTPSEYTDWYPSGKPVTVSHTYHAVGYVTISARAKDIYGVIGNESTFTFHIGWSKAISNSLLLWFLERFPLLERLLNLL